MQPYFRLKFFWSKQDIFSYFRFYSIICVLNLPLKGLEKYFYYNIVIKNPVLTILWFQLCPLGKPIIKNQKTDCLELSRQLPVVSLHFRKAISNAMLTSSISIQLCIGLMTIWHKDKFRSTVKKSLLLSERIEVKIVIQSYWGQLHQFINLNDVWQRYKACSCR